MTRTSSKRTTPGRMTGTIPLHELPVGAVFRLPFTGRIGTLKLVNECRARVTYHGTSKSRTIVARKGLPDEKTFKVPDRSDTVDISPNVLVEPLEDQP